MADNLPPQPQSDNPVPWPSSLDFMLLQQALNGDPAPLNYPDPPAVYSANQTGGADYTFYKIQHVYADDSGIDVLKTGNADQSTQSLHTVVQMHNPFTELRIVWTAQRWNAIPDIPSKDTKNPNNVYIRGVRSPMNAIQYPNGVLHRCSGIYLYKLLVGLTESDLYPTGVTPAETAKSTDADRMYGGLDIDETVLDASAAIPKGVSFPQIIVSSPPTPSTTAPDPIYVPPK